MKLGISRKVIFLYLGMGLVFCLLLLFNDPNGDSVFLPKCVFYKITSLHCPGCGASRAAYALLHGDILVAMRQNILLFFIFPLLLLITFYPEITAWRYFPHTLVFVIMAFWILRNISYFSFLAPY